MTSHLVIKKSIFESDFFINSKTLTVRDIMEWLRKTGDTRVSGNELSDDESSPTPLRHEYEIISIELLWYFLSW